MRYIALTGAAVGPDGRRIPRSELVRRCRRAGLIVGNTVRPLTDTLVASRDDTRKARAAKLRGLKVASYLELIAALEASGA